MNVGLPAISLLFILPIFVAAHLWTKKGGSAWVGVVLGVFLGWVGVLITYIATPAGGPPPKDRTDRWT
jgi:hypothetical protein